LFVKGAGFGEGKGDAEAEGDKGEVGRQWIKGEAIFRWIIEDTI
jgi:hypothetical protein